MPSDKEAATARIPVTPSTFRKYRSTMAKGETWDEAINGSAESRRACDHDWDRRTAYKRVCRKCGARGP